MQIQKRFHYRATSLFIDAEHILYSSAIACVAFANASCAFNPLTTSSSLFSQMRIRISSVFMISTLPTWQQIRRAETGISPYLPDLVP